MQTSYAPSMHLLSFVTRMTPQLPRIFNIQPKIHHIRTTRLAALLLWDTVLQGCHKDDFIRDAVDRGWGFDNM